MTNSIYKVGEYTPSEGSIYHRGREGGKPATDKLILCLHGRDINAPVNQACLNFSPSNGQGLWPTLALLADHGYVLMSIDAGGNAQWGSQASVDACVAAVADARADGICHPTAKIAVASYSHGGSVGMNYAYRHKTDVAGVFAFEPALNLDTLYAANGTWAAEMDSVFSPNYAAQASVRNPQAFASDFNLPTNLQVASDDPVIPVSMVTDFHNANPASNKQYTVLAGGGHTAFGSYVDSQALLAWLAGLSY